METILLMRQRKQKKSSKEFIYYQERREALWIPAYVTQKKQCTKIDLYKLHHIVMIYINTMLIKK